MSEKPRSRWKLWFVLLLLLGIAIYFGGGLWGWGGSVSFSDLKDLPEKTAQNLREKIDRLRNAKDQLVEDQKEAAEKEKERLQKILDSWAEDHYLNCKAKVDALIAQGKKQEAKALLDKIPAEYLTTSWKEKFLDLKRQVE